jgi:hypothetical protein
LTFGKGSQALDFVRTLRELSDVQTPDEIDAIGPVLVYGARIVTPDAPAELYVSIGALALAHVLGMQASPVGSTAMVTPQIELPADMALLFTAVPAERPLRRA